MPSTSFKVSFTIDEQDADYFRGLFRKAKQAAKGADEQEIVESALDLVRSVRRSKKTPHFVLEAASAVEDMVAVIVDEHYAAPKAVKAKVLAALAYFAHPHDLIPDDVPVLGFLDDAIMIKFVERNFRHELAAYRKFSRFARGAEQRPWTDVALKRLPERLAAKRAQLRAEVDRKVEADEMKGAVLF